MIVRSIEDVAATDLDVAWGNGQSRRLIVKRDGMGFAIAETLVLAGTVEDMAGNRHTIRPGVIYALDKHDKHYLRARSDMRLISVFNPPIEGHERHSLKSEGSSSY